MKSHGGNLTAWKVISLDFSLNALGFEVNQISVVYGLGDYLAFVTNDSEALATLISTIWV